jgi:hypothetical protein
MATGYLAENPDPSVKGFIGAGIRNGGSLPLDSAWNLKMALDKNSELRVLDIYGDGGDKKDASHALNRSQYRSNRYQQVLFQRQIIFFPARRNNWWMRLSDG